MVVRIAVAPELLQWAIERAGWDPETTARRAPKFDAWISGTPQPTLKQLEKFASDTHTPFGLLFLPEPPVEDLPLPDLRTIGNVTVPRPSADLLDTIYICQDRQDWYRGYAQDNGIIAPEFIGSATTKTKPILVANKIRDMLDFDLVKRQTFSTWKDALRSLIDRIENIGVLVMISGVVGANTHRKLNPEEFRGFVLSDPQVPLIFVNGADTKAAQIFTLIHELAHIWLGTSALSNVGLADVGLADTAQSVPGGLGEEIWCNQVAAEVLVPIATLCADYRGTANTEELERLAKKYRVSTLVVLKRIFDAGLLTRQDYSERYENEHERVMGILKAKFGTGGGGNVYNTQPIRLSRQFAQAVISSAFEGSSTYREAYRLLGTKKHSTFENLAAKLGVS